MAIATLAVNLIARTSAFERGMGRARKRLSFVQRQAMATRKALGGMFVGVVGAVGLAGITMLGKKFVEAASFAEESGNRFKEVFKLQARAAEQFAGKLASAVGRSETNLKDMMATLQDTFVPLGLARKKGAELSGQLVQLAIDVASFKDVADEKVLEDFTGALVGQSKAVLKYGIVTNIGALKQEMLRQGITKSFLALTEQEKVMLRFNVIMRSTTDAQGDAVRTAASHANMVKRLKSDYEELQITLGKKMMPSMTDLVAVTIKAIAAAEKINLNTVTSVIRYTAAAGAVVILAKGLTTLTLVTKGAAAAGFLWSGGLKRIAFRLRIATTAIIANTAALGLYVFAIGAVVIGLDTMNRAEAAAIRNSARFWKRRDDILRQAIKRQEDLREEIAATKRQEMADRSVSRQSRRSIFAEGGGRERVRLEHFTKLARKLIEDTRTPMERFTKKLGEIDTLLKEDVITLETYARAVRDAKKALEEAFNSNPLVQAGKALTESLLTPMERFRKEAIEIQKLLKGGFITPKTFWRAIKQAGAKALEVLAPSPQSFSDFGVLPGPEVSVKGLAIGGIDNNLLTESKKQTGYLAIIAGREELG